MLRGMRFARGPAYQALYDAVYAAKGSSVSVKKKMNSDGKCHADSRCYT